MTTTWQGRTLVAGEVTAVVLQLGAPLSFWGGIDPQDGRVIDRHHPAHGRVLSGQVVVMDASRGSSSSSSVLAEAIRLGTAPAAVVLGRPDAIVALGALAAFELYGVAVPIVAVDDWNTLPDGARVRVQAPAVGETATIQRVVAAHP